MANPEEYRLAFAKAWYKLTHRDMGPPRNFIGAEVPKDILIWQDPIDAKTQSTINNSDVKSLKASIMKTGLTVPELVRVAWASAASYRNSDKRGGANGARIALAPQKDWAVNNPAETAKVIAALSKVQSDFNKGRRKVSLADLIVLGGAAALEKAAKDAGYNITVPFTPGRGDATQDMTDVESFSLLELTADGFRNYFDAKASYRSPTEMLIDKADQLDLSVPEMTVLVGGMRALDANFQGAKHGVFTSKPGTLNNDFFVNLLDMSTVWSKSKTEGLYEGKDRSSNLVKWSATPVDLIFGSHSELRAVTEVYATKDGKDKFLQDFVKAWNKVMNADRFDVKKS